MKNCLVVRNYSNIGDLLMLTPALKELSKLFIVDLQIPKKYKDVFRRKLSTKVNEVNILFIGGEKWKLKKCKRK